MMHANDRRFSSLCPKGKKGFKSIDRSFMALTLAYSQKTRSKSPRLAVSHFPDHLPVRKSRPVDTHQWTVFLTSATSPPPPRPSSSNEPPPVDMDYLPGGQDDLGYMLRRVTFRLHETYTNPSRGVLDSVFTTASQIYPKENIRD